MIEIVSVVAYRVRGKGLRWGPRGNNIFKNCMSIMLGFIKPLADPKANMPEPQII